ncbi:D-galactarate dehydratase, partial [Salmonella enterica subsp. enterica serovar Typhimurium]
MTALMACESARLCNVEREISFVVHQDAPFGLLFAICVVPFHGEVFIYGESICRATQYIKSGYYVDFHIVVSVRGRGDWK